MIKPVRAWVDSQGVMHSTPEAAAKAEFQRLLLGKFECANERSVVTIGLLVESMYELEKMIGEAMREDSRADIAVKSDGA